MIFPERYIRGLDGPATCIFQVHADGNRLLGHGIDHPYFNLALAGSHGLYGQQRHETECQDASSRRMHGFICQDGANGFGKEPRAANVESRVARALVFSST